ncbi:hypothetical protein D3C84_981650 [compost metagenome]
MGHLLQVIVETGVFATTGVVDQLMRDAEMTGHHRRMNPAHGIDRENRLGSGLLQRPEIGAIVHPMRRDTVRMTMAREEQHFLAGILTDLYLGRRRTVGRIHRQ